MMDFKNESHWEDSHKFERCRYELMRRDPQYRQAWKIVKELREKAEKEHPGCTGLIEASEKTTPYSLTKEGQEEMRLAKKFGILGRLFDPDVSWDDLNRAQKTFLAFAVFRNDAVRFMTRAKSDPMSNKVTIEIDFEKVNSKDALKKYIGHKIDQFVRSRAEFNTKFYWKDFQRIMQVGDQKADNPHLTWREIAEKIFSNDTQEESAQKKVQQDFKKYQKLINGGYKKITYP
jgi:hypothetical protein